MPRASRPPTVLLALAALVVVCAGLKAAQPLLVPLVFAAFLSIISAPVVLWLRAHRIPSALGVPLVVAGVLVALGGLAGFLGGTLNAFVAAAPRYEARFEGLLGALTLWLEARGIETSRAALESMLDPGAAVNLVGGTISGIAALLSDALLVLLAVAFMLLEVTELPAKIREAMERPDADLAQFAKIAADVKRYVVVKTYLSLATGAALAAFLWIIGLDFALLWGFVAFLLNYVPNIGSVIAAVPPVLLALVQLGTGRAAAVLVAYVAVNMVVGNVVEPKLMGRSLGLSPLVVFVSLVFWGWLWGPMGMLLSVPLTMIVKIVLENTSEWRWAAVLMGNPTARSAPVAPVAPDGASEDAERGQPGANRDMRA